MPSGPSGWSFLKLFAGPSARRAASLASAPLRLLAASACLLALAFVATACRSELESSSWQDVSATLSPDAKLLASLGRPSAESGAPLSLRLRPADFSAPPISLASNASPLLEPVFSPDGKKLFHLRRSLFHMDLMAVPADASSASKELASLRVSPQHLTCLSSSTKILFICFMDGYFGVSSSVKAFDLRTCELRELASLPSSVVESAALSADGSTFVYTDGRSLWRLSLDSPSAAFEDIGAKLSPLDRPLQLALSSDASLLCLRTGRLEHRNIADKEAKFTLTDLSSIQYKTVDMRRLMLLNLKSSEAPKAIAEGAAFENTAFSPDSSRLAWTEGSGLVVCDLASGKKRTFVCPRYEFGSYLRWFGDSSLLARVMSSPKKGAQLYVFPLEPSGVPKPLIRD